MSAPAAGRATGVAICLHRERAIPARLVRQLYDDAGWWPRRGEEEIAAILDAGPAVGAWDGDRLVGVARAVSDGIFRAFVEDVVVAREYQRSGLGGRVLSRLLVELAGIETVSLFCDPALAAFYERGGFSRTGQLVMHRRGDR